MGNNNLPKYFLFAHADNHKGVLVAKGFGDSFFNVHFGAYA